MTAAKLIELEAKATEGEWYVGEIDKPDGYALAWLGNVYIDTHAPKVNGLSRYKDQKDDADFIVELRNHAQDFIKLIEAAEKIAPYTDTLICYASTADEFPLNGAVKEFHEALAAFKEQS